MTHWTTRRRWSLAIHTIIVLIPLTFSTVAALFFWQWLFQSWLIAGALVTVIDVLSLLGLALFIWRVPSPFQHLRHVLPFVSVVPLGYELWQQLAAHNGLWLTASVSVVVTAVLVGVAQRCYVTIEELFIDPTEAAEEKAVEQIGRASRAMQMQVAHLTVTLDTLGEMEQTATRAIDTWTRSGRVTIARSAPPQLPDDDALLDTLLALAPDDTGVPLSDASRLDLARRLRQQGKPWRTVAREVGVSDATLRRKLKEV